MPGRVTKEVQPYTYRLSRMDKNMQKAGRVSLITPAEASRIKERRKEKETRKTEKEGAATWKEGGKEASVPVHTTRSKRAEAPLWVTVRSDRRTQNEKIGKASLHKVLFFMRKKKDRDKRTDEWLQLLQAYKKRTWREANAERGITNDEYLQVEATRRRKLNNGTRYSNGFIRWQWSWKAV